jgi:trehalose synthase
MGELRKYSRFVGKEKIEELYKRAEKLEGKHILNINSTYQGGGVAEILSRFVPLMNELGIDYGWRILHGSPDFFRITKKLTNAMQGERINLTQQKKSIYIDINKRFSSFTHIHHDAVIIHDFQPMPLIKFYKKTQPWIWRNHSDTSSPNKAVYNYLKPMISKYDAAVILDEKFHLSGLKIPQYQMPPSIDPLSIKNKELSNKDINKYLDRFNIPLDRPIICQVSRFDKWKDHEGVLKIFRMVQRKCPCHLVLIGSPALDDPTSQKIYEKIIRQVDNDKNITIINQANDILVNALQTKSEVILQKSFKEGFGLTVAEALWKETPVLASKVGGITQQIVDGKSGYLLNPQDYNGFANRIVHIIKDKKLRNRLGKFGKEHVRKRFLITEHMSNWINILIETFKKQYENSKH